MLPATEMLKLAVECTLQINDTAKHEISEGKHALAAGRADPAEDLCRSLT